MTDRSNSTNGNEGEVTVDAAMTAAGNVGLFVADFNDLDAA